MISHSMVANDFFFECVVSIYWMGLCVRESIVFGSKCIRIFIAWASQRVMVCCWPLERYRLHRGNNMQHRLPEVKVLLYLDTVHTCFHFLPNT